MLLSLVAGEFLWTGSRVGPDCARPTYLFPFSPHPSGRVFKGPVGGLPHRGRIEGALFHRAPSASTGAPTHKARLSDRPLFLIPRHLPEHPLIP